MLIPDHLSAALERTAAARGPFGREVSYFDEVTSTNDLARAAAEAGAGEGTTIVAGAQTAGRGRLGRSWFSPPGAGLYVSTIVRRPAVIPWITLAAGVAVAEALTSACDVPVQIKWPNDIVTRGAPPRRKLAGILAEAETTGRGTQFVVLGIGINVRRVAVPPELASVASSIEAEAGRPIDSGVLLADVLAALSQSFSLVAEHGAPALLERWLALAPLARGASIEWEAGSGTVAGITAGIDADGALLARVGDETRRILSGAVRWS